MVGRFLRRRVVLEAPRTSRVTEVAAGRGGGEDEMPLQDRLRFRLCLPGFFSVGRAGRESDGLIRENMEKRRARWRLVGGASLDPRSFAQIVQAGAPDDETESFLGFRRGLLAFWPGPAKLAALWC